ncbi:MAG: tRNA (N(6)-L-threonylcarbamoyladenosine(37)-C(2))-methylthiotransferase MtaB [Treponema sp.]|jgi:threonylcarbamoyladenosine tRNA methylthiotransferase MtaB|nr:tRNA (N(6)-L-threonylcarbamoyladenosine(37)-C(2))-methylthiotransferase MtaB [Treponema sp.]
MNAAFYTLGCKLNQIETESIADAFRRGGFSLVSWEQGADLAVINTCTVTSRAEQKARRVIRLALSRCKTVLLTGCSARSGEEAALAGSRAERLVIIPGTAKDTLLDLPRFLADTGKAEGRSLRAWAAERLRAGAENADPEKKTPKRQFRFNPSNFSFHSRAFLKIQDGCDRSCAYCRVPLVRGRSVSLDAAEVLARLRDLETRGFDEAVLTAVNLCQYEGGRNFAGLLELLLEGTERIALRLSSIDPALALDDAFIRAASDRRIRPHFHLSVQSGSDAVLAAMGRPYTRDSVGRAVSRLREAKDDPFIACDIITGFPGEDEGAFLETRALCGELDFAGIHAFPFSRRPGTRAFSLKNRVPERLAVLRVGELLALSRTGRRRYAGRWLGKTVEAVRLGEQKKSLFCAALADNYLKVGIKSDRLPPRGAFLCELKALNGGDNGGTENFDMTGEIARG